MTYDTPSVRATEASVAMSEATHLLLTAHLRSVPSQEELAFAYWRPSRGRRRMTAVLSDPQLPQDGEHQVHGNASFNGAYLRRVLHERPTGAGIAFLHSHLGPGWQDMSHDDVVAERDRISGAACPQSDLPLLGLTLGMDGTWSARFWSRSGPNQYERTWAPSVRVVGPTVTKSWAPAHTGGSQHSTSVSTQSVWGPAVQDSIAKARVGIVGLGSVGSIVCESLARMGVRDVTLIDHDRIELRNLDRTVGAARADASEGVRKVTVASRHFKASATAPIVSTTEIPGSLLSAPGLAAALDCDVLFSCVDRPLPRHILNAISYSHLIPVIDGGILAKVDRHGLPLHVDWRIHTVGPGARCLVCLGALSRSDVALDRDGQLDNPDYIANLPEHDRARASRRNIFPFSLSVAAHMSLQFAKVFGAGERIGGTGPQWYHAYPGRMDVERPSLCEADCEYASLLASAVEPADLVPPPLMLPTIAPSATDQLDSRLSTPPWLKVQVRRIMARWRR